MKKRNVILLAGILTLTGMTGCGTGEVKEILDESRENTKEIASASGDVEVTTGVNLSQWGMDMDVDLVLAGEWETAVNPAAFHFDGTLGLDVMGFGMDFEIYGVEEDGKYVTYAKTAGQWSKFEGQAKSFDNWDGFYELEPDSIELSQESGEVNEKETSVIHTEISGEDVIELMKKAEFLEDDLGDADISGLKADIALEIYKESGLPASVNVDFGDSLSSAAQSSEELAGLPGVGKCVINVNVMEYNSVDSIEVPQEALTAEETEGNPLKDLTDDMFGTDGQEDVYTPEEAEVSEDGSYVLTSYSGDVSARVTAPEGYTADSTEKTFLSFSRTSEDNKQTFAVYQITELSDSFTEEDFVKTYMVSEDELADYGYRYYRTAGPEEMELGDMTVSCVTAVYSYEEGTVCTQTEIWTKLDDNHILQCMVTETEAGDDREPSLDAELAKEVFSGVSADTP